MSDAPLGAAEREAMKQAAASLAISHRHFGWVLDNTMRLLAALAAAEAGREAAERATQGEAAQWFNMCARVDNAEQALATIADWPLVVGDSASQLYGLRDIARRALASGSPPRTEDGT